MKAEQSVPEDLVHVSEKYDGERLDLFIASRYPSFSRAHIQRCIAEGLIKLNGRIPKKRDSVKFGDKVLVAERQVVTRVERTLIAEDIPLDVIYEDKNILALNKPAGIVVHPGCGNWSGTIVNALLYHCTGLSNGYGEDRPGIVHRLDKDTSGALLVAKDDYTHTALSKLFTDRLIDKRYVGVCAGKRPDTHEMIDAPIARSRSNPVLRTVHHTGKSAQTEYDLLSYQSGVSFLYFRLHTGRTHQIRVHCRHAGFPILADSSYGGGRDQIQRLEPLERPYAYKVFKCFTRHALHAYSLRFMHPITGKEIFLRAPLPDDFRSAFATAQLNPDLLLDSDSQQSS